MSEDRSELLKKYQLITLISIGIEYFNDWHNLSSYSNHLKGSQLTALRVASFPGHPIVQSDCLIFKIKASDWLERPGGTAWAFPHNAFCAY